jgi:hydroxycarboxylate dehydrogenase B
MIRIQAAALRKFVGDIFVASGVSREESDRIAHYLVIANLTGHDSHGVIRVPLYVKWKKEGAIVAGQTATRCIDLPSLAVVDGGFGFGQTIAPQAVQIGIDKCRESGAAIVALRNTGHIGRIGDWAEMAAAEKLVSVHFVNAAGSVLVAPFGGIERRLSTAPFCVGIPTLAGRPVVLDFATSMVAEGKVLVASRGGKPLPADALIGPDGKTSADCALLYGPHTPDGPRDHSVGKGAIRAFGGHKGSGLALICELLGGALTGNGATRPNRRFSNGMLSIYIDPVRIDPDHLFGAEVARYIHYFKSAKPAAGAFEVLTPGEPEERSRLDRTAYGIPLAEETWAAICGTARDVGISDQTIGTVADCGSTRSKA